MGKHLNELKRKRMEERMRDPHEWAYQMEQREGGRALVILAIIAGLIGLGLWVYSLKQDIAALQVQIRALQAAVYN